MKRLRLAAGFMAMAILAMLACLLFHSPLMMVLFLTIGPACAGIAVLLFATGLNVRFGDRE